MIETSGHLPECSNRPYNGERCICDRLRACEQRVRENEHRALITHGAKTNLAGYSEGYAAGVQAARDAVAALPFVRPAYYGKGVLIYGAEPDFVRADALAAIDALTEEAS